MLSSVSVFSSVHVHTILLHILPNDSRICALSRFPLYYALVYRIFIGVNPYLILRDCFKRLFRIVSCFPSPFSKCLHWWFISLVCTSTPSLSSPQSLAPLLRKPIRNREVIEIFAAKATPSIGEEHIFDIVDFIMFL